MIDTLPALPRQADTEVQVVSMWLHGRPAHTQALYADAYQRFAAHVGKPLERVTVGDLQSYAATLVASAVSSTQPPRTDLQVPDDRQICRLRSKLRTAPYY